MPQLLSLCPFNYSLIILYFFHLDHDFLFHSFDNQLLNFSSLCSSKALSLNTNTSVSGFFTLVFSLFLVTRNSNIQVLLPKLDPLVRRSTREQPSMSSRRRCDRSPSFSCSQILLPFFFPSLSVPFSLVLFEMLASTFSISRRAVLSSSWRSNLSGSVYRCYQTSSSTSSVPQALSSILPNHVDSSSLEFKENKAFMEELISKLDSRHQKIGLGGTQKARARHVGRGRMLARERIEALLDKHSPFLELSPLAGFEMYEGEEVPAGGVITGVGRVSG